MVGAVLLRSLSLHERSDVLPIRRASLLVFEIWGGAAAPPYRMARVPS